MKSKDSLQILLNSKIKKYFYKLPRKMKTLFRIKHEMCLFKHFKHFIAYQNLEKLVFANSEVHWFCDLQTISETTVVLMEK
jgi:hypothetical protein